MLERPPNINRVNKSRRMSWKGYVARIGKMRNEYKMLILKREGKKPIGRSWRGWVDNIRMDLTETGWEGVNWMRLAQDRDQWRAVVNTVMDPQVSKCGEFLD
jgi:hypothetical protein